MSLLGARVLGDGLGSLADGVLGELTGQKETDCRLDFATRDGRAAIVVGEARRFGGDALEDGVHEAVHDRHRLAADAGIGVNLLQHLVDVDGIALPSALSAFLVARSDGLRLAGGLLRSLRRWFRWHDCDLEIKLMFKEKNCNFLNITKTTLLLRLARSRDERRDDNAHDFT